MRLLTILTLILLISGSSAYALSQQQEQELGRKSQQPESNQEDPEQQTPANNQPQDEDESVDEEKLSPTGIPNSEKEIITKPAPAKKSKSIENAKTKDSGSKYNILFHYYYKYRNKENKLSSLVNVFYGSFS